MVVNDKLGIADELEARMQHIVDTYQDEWATVVDVRLSFVQTFVWHVDIPILRSTTIQACSRTTTELKRTPIP